MTESVVFLHESVSGDMVQASLFDEVSDDHLALWDSTWEPKMKVHRASTAVATPEDSHWDWNRKAITGRRLLGYQSFAVICRGELEGLMLTNDITSARLQDQFGKPIVYVDFVSTAPWNRPELGKPRYRGVGRILVLAAIQLSLDAGYKGRIGLHSLPKAEEFYERKCGFTKLGTDSSHQDLIYYEMNETQAERFRQNQ